VGHVTRMVKCRNTRKNVSSKYLKEINHVGDLGLRERLILKRILKKTLLEYGLDSTDSGLSGGFLCLFCFHKMLLK
jgi:hypothetical protein